jgi:hypothetical protein
MTRRQRAWLAGALLAGAAATALSFRIAAGSRIRGEPGTLLALIAGWWALFALGAVCVLRLPRRAAVVVIVTGAVALRLAALAGVPALSNDLDRYAWDGRVQLHGTDPYRYPPDARALDRLHDRWLWPGPARCRAIHQRPGCIDITRSDVRTIYPPVAEAWFTVVAAAAPSGSRSLVWQVAGMVVDLAALAVMLALLGSWGRDPRYAVLYAWSPIAVLAAVQNGHADGLAVLFILGALWALRRRPGLAGGLLGAAAMTKLYPALLGVLLLRRRGWRRAVAAFAAVVIVGYLPHVIAVGPHVLGYLPGYLNEENYAHGGRFLLLGMLGIGGTAAQALAALALAVVVALVVLRGGALRADVAARRLLGVALLIATPVQPWYAVTLAAVAALEGAWWWLAVAAAGYPLFFRVLEGVPLGGLASPDVGRLSYGLALVIVLAGAAWRRRAAPAVTSEAAA